MNLIKRASEELGSPAGLHSSMARATSIPPGAVCAQPQLCQMLFTTGRRCEQGFPRDFLQPRGKFYQDKQQQQITGSVLHPTSSCWGWAHPWQQNVSRQPELPSLGVSLGEHFEPAVKAHESKCLQTGAFREMSL